MNNPCTCTQTDNPSASAPSPWLKQNIVTVNLYPPKINNWQRR